MSISQAICDECGRLAVRRSKIDTLPASEKSAEKDEVDGLQRVPSHLSPPVPLRSTTSVSLAYTHLD